MAALIRKGTYFGAAQRQWAATQQLVRNYWNKDWKPGPIPTTREGEEAAAKKFGLHPSEYKPYPDDGLGFGEYPQLPNVSGEAKDPYYPWDFPEHKRNFNEPLHLQADMYGEDRFDVSSNPPINKWRQLGTFLAVVLGAWAIFKGTNNIRMVPPVMPKQYPQSGVKHYTFESPE
ncbi:hypothetical protein R5R35_001591 [Gryllus longicercus]|uniref:NADH dehydrogenase [ubiquinone] 1 beta subcomplex subunit 8, mitochondrial n=1 Tax=Gryllus longicercus TaxID=2509291 RepID=A0AAN9WAA9_9ORTH